MCAIALYMAVGSLLLLSVGEGWVYDTDELTIAFVLGILWLIVIVYPLMARGLSNYSNTARIAQIIVVGITIGLAIVWFVWRTSKSVNLGWFIQDTTGHVPLFFAILFAHALIIYALFFDKRTVSLFHTHNG